MNDTFFSNKFKFLTLKFRKFKYTDNRRGALVHYFAYMLRGKCNIVTDSCSVAIHEGDFFYIPEGLSYQSYWYGEPKIEFISLGFPFLPNFGNKNYPCQVMPFDSESADIFIQLAEAEQTTPYYIARFYTLAAALLQKMSCAPLCRTAEIVRTAKDYLLSHPHADAACLARHCAISEAALYAAFQKSSDLTPNRLRNNMLLEKARDLLITTDNSVEYISEKLGFSSTSYFRKKFKEYFAITPREMRKRYMI